MLSEAIFTITTPQEFEKIALEVFRYQYINNPVYQRFCNLLGIAKTSVKKVEDIPYLPIEFFKKEIILATSKPIQEVFTSSGTTGNITSKHYVADLQIYLKSFRKGFEYFYGDIEEYTILGLLPSYLERKGSSLVFMVSQLIQDSKQSESGFYLHDIDRLKKKLSVLTKQKKKILLVGVTFALLDLIEEGSIILNSDDVVMETGGMKGRRKEMIRQEVHEILKKGFEVTNIHSEYGMTELLSQAYSKGDGIFASPPWIKICIRDPEDAMTLIPYDKTGGINVIDLANINSCSFIATQDLGKLHENGTFEVLGRFDHSDIRGCNLMVL